jgi:hypothetical protein
MGLTEYRQDDKRSNATSGPRSSKVFLLLKDFHPIASPIGSDLLAGATFRKARRFSLTICL